MAYGTLHLFLGSAPGVGKTYAMLREAQRLSADGSDVMIAAVADQGRAGINDLLSGLIEDGTIGGRGAGLVPHDLDLRKVIERAPRVVVIDDYAFVNPHGSRNGARWQDIEEVLEAGINVLSTLGVEGIDSLRDAVESITGVLPEGSVPDEVVLRAGRIELVDIAPEGLRGRLIAGEIHSPEDVDAALAGYFRLGNLWALRELALIWLADRVDERLAGYRSVHGIRSNWPARERIVVGISGGTEGEILVRRAARILARGSGGNLLVIHVLPAGGESEGLRRSLESQRQLVTGLGGEYQVIAGDDTAEALLTFARNVNATQIVVGTSRRRALQKIFDAGTSARVVRESGDIDVHLVPHPMSGQGLPRRAPGALPRLRVTIGFVLAVVVPSLIVGLLVAFPALNFATAALAHLTGVLVVAFVGGLWPAVVAAFLASMLLNYFNTEPAGTFLIHDPQVLFAVVVFIGVAVAVSIVVGLSARRSSEASAARAEAATLTDLAHGALLNDDSISAFLEQVRSTFQMTSVALFTRADDGPGKWHLEAVTGQPVPAVPEQADNVDLPDHHTALTLNGRTLTAGSRRLLTAHGAHLLALRQREELRRSHQDNLKLVEGNKIRTAILRAVSHDLRTPMAGIKLAVTALRRQGTTLDGETKEELLETIDSYSQRMDALVANLLDMSRIASDMVNPLIGPQSWREVVDMALRTVPAGRIRVELPANLAPIEADEGLLERVVANIVENALKYAPGSDIVILGSSAGIAPLTKEGRPASEVRIIDHGQGVAAKDVVTMFAPFQRLNDAPAGMGIGLGLAVAKGFTECMAGELEAEPTPGGGLTVTIRLPLTTELHHSRQQTVLDDPSSSGSGSQ